MGRVRQNARSSEGRSAWTISAVPTAVAMPSSTSRTALSSVPNVPEKRSPMPTGCRRSDHSTNAARPSSKATISAANIRNRRRSKLARARTLSVNGRVRVAVATIAFIGSSRPAASTIE
jgi:hypothetical protein